MRMTRRCFAALTLATAARAQTLARPGWRGNGIAAEAWWKHTAIVRLPQETTFAQAGAAMDAMSQAGMDTLLLPDLQPAPGSALPFDERFGSEDDLDALLREMSARRMHVLLTAPLLRLGGNSGEVRFWLTRGIAGFAVGAVRPADADTLYLLRGAMDRFPGQRLLLVRGVNALHDVHSVLTLPVVSPGAAPAGTPRVIDFGSGPLPSNLPGSVIPMLNAASIEADAVREQVRRLLAARVSPVRARRDR